MRVILAKRGNYSLEKDYRRLYSVCQKMSQVLPAIGLTHIHQFLQFLAHYHQQRFKNWLQV